MASSNLSFNRKHLHSTLHQEPRKRRMANRPRAGALPSRAHTAVPTGGLQADTTGRRQPVH